MNDTSTHVIQMGGTRENIALWIIAAEMAGMGPGTIQTTSHPFEYTIVGNGEELRAFFKELDALLMLYHRGSRKIAKGPKDERPENA